MSEEEERNIRECFPGLAKAVDRTVNQHIRTAAFSEPPEFFGVFPMSWQVIRNYAIAPVLQVFGKIPVALLVLAHAVNDGNCTFYLPFRTVNRIK